MAQVKSLRSARGYRLGATQRKLPEIHFYLLYFLGFVELLGFPILGAGTSSLFTNSILTGEKAPCFLNSTKAELSRQRAPALTFPSVCPSSETVRSGEHPLRFHGSRHDNDGPGLSRALVADRRCLQRRRGPLDDGLQCGHDGAEEEQGRRE